MKDRGHNLTRLRQKVHAKLVDYKEMLRGEIRTIGLREKIEKRIRTLQKIAVILENHKE